MAQLFVRSFPLEDIRILSRAQGSEYADGRTVEAYAAAFDIAAEVVDHEGHYMEIVERTAFNKAINDARPQGSRANWNVGVFYNHGKTLYGTPSDKFSVPLGSPVDIRAEERGLLTVTRFNSTALAEEILEAIKAGDITGQSFTGQIVRSNPLKPPRMGYKPGPDGALKTIRRTELGLTEYGPTPFPVYADAGILAVRSMLAGLLPGMTLSVTPETPPDEADEAPTDTGTPPDDGAAADTPPPAEDEGHVSRHEQLSARIRAFKATRPGLSRPPSLSLGRAAEIARAGQEGTGSP